MIMVNLNEPELVLLIQLLQKEVGQKFTVSPTVDFDGGFEGVYSAN
jgi:hypothetical protein